MSTALGKRKRRTVVSKSLDKSEENYTAYQDAMRKHFESTFTPVEALETASGDQSLLLSRPGSSVPGEDSDTADDSDWDGLSDTPVVQVVSHTQTASTSNGEGTIKSMRKQFMSSKPPVETTDLVSRKSKSSQDRNGGLKSASSLTAEDLALQRLLNESHLLSGSTTSPLLPTLKARQTAQDMRFQTLGAKKSLNILGAGNAPMAVRKGIMSKKLSKEHTRRKEAKEAGIVLEKEVKSPTHRNRERKRARDVGAPAVGKWKGGTLMLGKRDVAEIEGQRLASDFGKKGKGRKKGRRK